MSRTLPNHPASKCHPSVLPTSAASLPTSAASEVGAAVVGGGVVGGAVVGGGVVGGAVVGGGGVVGGLLVAGAEGGVLVDGADFVGPEDDRPLDVGLAELVAVGVLGSVPRLVPG